MKKVVILGSKGMAGHIVAEYLHCKEKYEIIGVARENGKCVSKILDITRFDNLEKYLTEVQPDFVINCIGLLIADSQKHTASAILINSYLPHFLSELGLDIGFKLIHISTDCVFSGKDGGYKEDSFRDGDDNYARTKALGEVINNKDLTIRTSIIGPELKHNGSGLLDWFFKQKGEIKGFTKAYWSGVTTLELAKAIHEILQQNITGLYHLCPKKKISKYELLKNCNEIWNKQVKIMPFDNYAIDKSLLCTRQDLVYNVPDYWQMLIDLKEWMEQYNDYYMHYMKV